MPCTLLGPKSANAHALKKPKTSRKELSSHKHTIIEGMHLASIPNCKISCLTKVSESTVCATLKLLLAQLKGKSLQRNGRPSKLDKVTKRNIIRFVRQNVKATYAQVKHELSLDCSE
jgi:hypothetical protein